MWKITIFTPTYNRAYSLERLYISIKDQSFKNFEWIIVDDGSDDNTEEIVKEFIATSNFEIKYIKQDNCGKHIAINEGLKIASGELFFIVDSDDYLTQNSLELIKIAWDSIDNKKEFIGVGGRKYSVNRKNRKFNFNEKYFDSNAIDFNLKYKNIQDKAEVFETKKMKKYEFKKFEGEKFMAESVVWYKMAEDGYKIRWFNEKIYISEYLEDGLTSNFYQQRINSINSTCYCYNQLSSYKLPIKYKLRYKVNYFRYGLVKFDKKYLINNLKDKRFYRICYFIGKYYKENIDDKY